MGGTASMPDEVEWPAPNAPGVEVHHPQFTLGAALLFLVPWAIPVGLIAFCSLIPGMMLGEAILGEDSPFVALIFLGFAATVGIGLCWLLVSIRRRVYTRTSVTISPVGVHVRDHRGSQLWLRWADATAVTQLQIPNTPTALARTANTVAYELASLGQQIHPYAGLIGWGTRHVAANLPKREAAALAAQRRDPETGRYEVTVPFNLAGPVTQYNRLVQSTQHYRPDLLPPTSG